jgi:DNA-binding transcriptional MocR family regulator
MAPPRAPVNAAALIRGMFHSVSDKPQPGMGVFPPDWLEGSFMAAAVRKVTTTRRCRTFSLQYGEPAGDPGPAPQRWPRSWPASTSGRCDQIITTVGATHALDIVSRTCCAPATR